MELLKQIRVAVVGLPDSGKSTLIKTIAEKAIGKHIPPDTLMREVHWSDGRDPYGNPDTRTIKCAKIIFKYKEKEFCFYDCPGHLEYEGQILQGIKSAHFIIKLIDDKRQKESFSYLKHFDIKKDSLMLFSHSGKNSFPFYDCEKDGFEMLSINLLNKLYDKYEGVDIENEALYLISTFISGKTAMFFSGGKDSLVGLDLFKRAKKDVDVFFPKSGYDFEEVEKMIDIYSDLYNIDIKSFDNSLGHTYNEPSFVVLNAKAEANNRFIKNNDYKYISVQFRASDEGVRSKDYFISKRENHTRFSPVFYFSESNIWRYISKYKLEVCPLYFNGYRSLGDKPITEPCMPKMNNVEDIIKWIDSNPDKTEREGRKSQDNSISFAMEKLRNNGFF